MIIKKSIMCMMCIMPTLQAALSVTADTELGIKSAALVALQSEKLALQVQKEAALKLLDVIEAGGKLALDGTRVVLKAGMSSVVRIESMKGHFGVTDLVSGVLPNITVELMLFGKKKEIKNITFDVKNPAKSIKDIVTKIVDLVIIV